MYKKMIGMVWAMLCCSVVWADSVPLSYDRVRLSATSVADVEQDTLIALLFVQQEGVRTQPLVDQVNSTIAWGLAQAKKKKSVKVQTLAYHSQPIYRNQNITGWRVRQSLRLESKDIPTLSRLIGELQEKLNVESVGYAVSRSAMDAVNDKLVVEALAAFRQRAHLIAKEMGASDYRLVSLNINAAGRHQPVLRIEMQADSQFKSRVAPPQFEAGSREVQANVDGTIELKY